MWFFLSSGMFLGWTLGANDAANVFGTAVGTRMLKFRTAAILCSVCVLLGAVLEGAGPSETLGQLGGINMIAGGFTVALAAALAVAIKTKLKLPVSTSQAVVGAIIGWNIFAGHETDPAILFRIVGSWIVCPILAALFSIMLYWIFKHIIIKSKVHLLTMDAYTRFGLILVGMMGAYSLGANNIANVMGVFVIAAPFEDIVFFDALTFSGTRQLFLLGGIAISIGIFTYSGKVMETVGRDLFRLSPVTALIIVLSHSMVLYIFASKSLRNLFMALGLPEIPLVPVSSSQAIIGAIIGIALIKGMRNINWKVLSGIVCGWIATPVTAGIVSYILLFIMQNVFNLTVS